MHAGITLLRLANEEAFEDRDLVVTKSQSPLGQTLCHSMLHREAIGGRRRCFSCQFIIESVKMD